MVENQKRYIVSQIFHILHIFNILLIVVSSGYEINKKKIWVFAHKTATLFYKSYPWYNMPPLCLNNSYTNRK